MIPKIIHFCWFGKTKKSKEIKICIESWKYHLKDFLIMEWNESNCDFSHPFVRDAYANKGWAFVSDYIRLQKIYEFGGMYLDVDMLVLTDFSHIFKEKKILLGAEKKELLNAAFIASEPKNSFVKSCIEAYDTIVYDDKNRSNFTNPKVITKIYRKMFNYEGNFSSDIDLDELLVLSPNKFYSFPGSKRTYLPQYRKYTDPNAYAIHLWLGSWCGQDEFYNFRNRKYSAGFKIVIKNSKSNKKGILSTRYAFKIIKTIVYSIKYSFSNKNYLIDEK